MTEEQPPLPLPEPETAAEAPPLGPLDEARLAASFLTALPISPGRAAGRSLSEGARAFPLVGLGLGLLGAFVYWLADGIGFAADLAALTATAAIVAASGALHEDGLGDFADGLGGGDPESRLAIMRDSRIGGFGVVALILAFAARVGALGHAGSAADAALMLIAAATLSRACLPPIMYLTRPARVDGLAAAAGRPERRRVVDAVALGVFVAILCLGIFGGLAAAAAAWVAAAALAWLAQRKLGGHTGDSLGAAQQAAEIAVLFAYLATPF